LALEAGALVSVLALSSAPRRKRGLCEPSYLLKLRA
jgi:hypothetical protein